MSWRSRICSSQLLWDLNQNAREAAVSVNPSESRMIIHERRGWYAISRGSVFWPPLAPNQGHPIYASMIEEEQGTTRTPQRLQKRLCFHVTSLWPVVLPAA
jgi:hypothetical protein